MGPVRLTGQLICVNDQQAQVVAAHLPAHIMLTRAEPGCISFDVTETADPLIWDVAELFADGTVFGAHQERVAGSEWGARHSGLRTALLNRNTPRRVNRPFR